MWLATAFALFWLAPLLWMGFTNRDVPGAPRFLSYVYRFSHLFVQPQWTWPTFYIEGRRAGRGQWEELPERAFFQLEPFGYRTRLSMALADVHYAQQYEAAERQRWHRYAEVADWIAAEAPRRLGGPALAEVRLLRVLHRVADAQPSAGRWRKPPLSSIPAERREVLITRSAAP